MKSLEQMLNCLDTKIRGINWDCPRQTGTNSHPINSGCLFDESTKHLVTFIHLRQTVQALSLVI